MGCKIQDGASWWDRWTGRNFRSQSLPMIQDPVLSTYNPVYLSVFYSLQRPGEPLGQVTQIDMHNGFHRYQLPQQQKQMYLGDFLNQFIKHEKRPWFLVNGDTNLLSRMKFDGADFRHLKNKEVAFYFFEPLFQRAPGQSRVPAFYGRDSEVLFPELVWLEDFLYNHQDSFRAKVYVCDYRLQNFLKLKNLHPKLEVKTWDIFLASTLDDLKARERDRDPCFHLSPYVFKPEAKKKYICLNYRYEGFRELVTGFLRSGPFSNQGYISFFHKHDMNELQIHSGFDATSLSDWPQIKDGILGMQNELPLTLDTQNSVVLHPKGFSMPDIDGESNIRTTSAIHKWYDDSFISVVNETRFATYCGEVSEKTFVPIMYMTPFVLVGGPHMLKYLRELGFETFGDFWDESYDSIEDHKERMEAIFRLLNDLLSKPMSEIHEMRQKMEPLLRRNRRFLFLGFRKKMLQFISEEQGGAV